MQSTWFTPTQKEFERAKEKIVGIQRARHGIGTLGEKTVHAVLKNCYAPDEDMHEIPIGGYVADIYTGREILEIQTGSFHVLRDKLRCYLKEYPVTVIHPIPCHKWLIWMDEETGEMSPRRKSPVVGNEYMAFKELYKIKSFLKDPNIRFRFVLLDMEEYRLLNGWSRDKKRGSSRFDRLPVEWVREVAVECPRDYMQFVPPELEGDFTSKDFAGAAHIKTELAGTVLNILNDLGTVERVGKRGRNYLYRV